MTTSERLLRRWRKEALRWEKYLLGSHMTISIDMAQSHSIFNEVNKVVKCHFVPLDSADI